MESEKRKFKDLRVIDLRNELSKRGLDTTGLKPVLAERLKKALEAEAEDLDLDTFEFVISEELTTNDSEKVVESPVSLEQDGKPEESEMSEVKVDESVLVTEDSSAQKAKVDESVIATEDSSAKQEEVDDCVLVTEDSAAQETKENEVVESKDIGEVKNSTPSVGEKIKLSGAARKRYKWLVSQGHPLGHETKWLAAHPTLEIFEAMKNRFKDTSSEQLGSTDESKEKRETVHVGDNSSAKKLDDSFKEATGSVPIGILSSNYPNQSLTTEQMLTVQKCVMDRILEQANKELKPQFSGCNFKMGWMLFDCSNRSTAEWLKGIVDDLQPWQGASLKAVEASDIPRLHVIKGYFPNSAEKTSEAILGYVAAQNDGLEAQKWGVIRRETEGSGVLITLSIDHSAAEQLKKCSFKIHYQFGTVQLKSKGSLRENYVESRRKRKASTAPEGQATAIKVAPQPQPSAEKPTFSRRQRLRWRQNQKRKIATTTVVETPVVVSAKQRDKATSLAVPSSSPRAPGPRMESSSRAMNSMFAEARRRSKSNGEGSRSSRKPPIRSMPNDRRGAPVVEGVSRKPHNQYSRSRSRSPIAPSPPRFFSQASSQREHVNMSAMSNNMRPYPHAEANDYNRNYGNQSTRSDIWADRRMIDNYAEPRSDYRASGASVSREASLRALGPQGMRGHHEEQFNNFNRRRQEDSSRENTRYPDTYYKNRPY
ncbi:uncharacterized protein LOC129807164 [Phlebotomus papatasi]|uniref:uncharacterized protein LOC129807164 n=1 Tax=Phlebotomus papatasi TaxID=29031 RepID=UPI0024842D68|nr:uncharacterized protein LOC129807164 [Phlebotomus papatasi]